jgi:hypothetical protein
LMSLYKSGVVRTSNACKSASMVTTSPWAWRKLHSTRLRFPRFLLKEIPLIVLCWWQWTYYLPRIICASVINQYYFLEKIGVIPLPEIKHTTRGKRLFLTHLKVVLLMEIWKFQFDTFLITKINPNYSFFFSSTRCQDTNIVNIAPLTIFPKWNSWFLKKSGVPLLHLHFKGCLQTLQCSIV